MRQVGLGRTAEAVSAIGYGAMALSTAPRPSEEDALRAIAAALDAGVTLFDTADVYSLGNDDRGHNERLLAKALRAHPARDQVRIATKGGMLHGRNGWQRVGSPEHLRAACEQSLRNLGVEQIFLYQLHAPDHDFERSVETLARLRDEGKIAHAGVSNVAVAHIERAEAIVPLASVQNRLSPFFRESIEEGVIAECARRGITFLAWRPFGGSQLAAALADFPALGDIAQARGVSPHAIALAWMRAQSPQVVPLPGGCSPEHIAANARAAEIELSAEEIAAIDAARWIQEKRFCVL